MEKNNRILHFMRQRPRSESKIRPVHIHYILDVKVQNSYALLCHSHTEEQCYNFCIGRASNLELE